MLRIRFILLRIRIIVSDSESDLKSRKFQLLYSFYFIKNIMLPKIFCFSIYELIIWLIFCVNWPWFWLIVCYPDLNPDPEGRNETEPHGYGSATLYYIINISMSYLFFFFKSTISHFFIIFFIYKLLRLLKILKKHYFFQTPVAPNHRLYRVTS